MNMFTKLLITKLLKTFLSSNYNTNSANLLIETKFVPNITIIVMSYGLNYFMIKMKNYYL